MEKMLLDQTLKKKADEKSYKIYLCTVWKFNDLSNSQILRENNFGDFTGCQRSKFPLS